MAKTILLVEDNDALRRAMRRALVAEGFHVLSAGDCEQAVDLARESKIDGAILDFVLPDVDGRPCDGVDLLMELRPLLPGVRFALVSGLLPPDPRVRTARFDEVLPKPIELDEVVALARRLTS